MKTEEPHAIAIPVAVETPLKEMVVNYIGEKINPANGDVTVQMAVDVFAAEFPEFLLAIAEENFLRGYSQALDDLENTKTSNQLPIPDPEPEK